MADPAKTTLSKFNPSALADAAEGKSKILWIAVQVVVGLVIAYAVYMLSLLAVNADKLGIDDKFDINKKSMVTIIDGYAESSQFTDYTGTFNTSVPNSAGYLPIRASVNLRGGSQFTYSLWLYNGTSNYADSGMINKAIFLKGDKKPYSFTVQDLTSVIKSPPKQTTERAVFCPMLCFGANEMEFTVYFNTFHNYKESFEIKNIDSQQSTTRNNLLNMYTKKWVMLTIVFEDNMPINEFENGILVKFYVNDMLYQTGRFSSALKQNNGSLYMFPDGPMSNCRVSNMVYFNYAATDNEIRRLADKGPSDKPTSAVTKSFISPAWISDYNRMDMYNS